MFDKFFDRFFKILQRLSLIHTLLIVLGMTGGLAFVTAWVADVIGLYRGGMPYDVSISFLFVAFLFFASYLLYKAFRYILRIAPYGARNQLITAIVAEMAYKNARCDAALFDTFNNAVLGPAEGQFSEAHDLFAECSSIIDHNIEDVLDFTAAIFTAYTGHVSCACLKAPAPNPAKPKDLSETQIVVLKRDARSVSVLKRTNNQPYKLSSNSSFRDISNGTIQYFACDDLVLAEKERRYENPRPDWKKEYTGTLVLPIRSLRRNARGLEDGRLTAFLCVDNTRGNGFESDGAYQHARSICSRLEVMLHRVHTFDEVRGRR